MLRLLTDEFVSFALTQHLQNELLPPPNCSRQAGKNRHFVGRALAPGPRLSPAGIRNAENPGWMRRQTALGNPAVMEQARGNQL
jgi:hypothetical protein